MKQVVKGSDILANINLIDVDLSTLTYLQASVSTDNASVFTGSLAGGEIVEIDGVYILAIPGSATELMAEGLLIYTIEYGLTNPIFTDGIQNVVVNGDFCTALVEKYVI
jgi:hypothetical protein